MMMVLAKNTQSAKSPINGENHKTSLLEDISFKIIKRIGTPVSLIIHSILFMGIFALKLFGVETDFILLILTTAVSLEAIYLSIFIQMSVNKATESLEEVEEDIEDIQEDSNQDDESRRAILHIGTELKAIQKDLNLLKKKGII